MTSLCTYNLGKSIDETLLHFCILSLGYGLRGVVLDWFWSYLHNRWIRVKCKPTSSGQTETSAEFTVEYGTPQGSCLGPLIFLIFCNDLWLNLLYLQYMQFADDTTLILGQKNHRYLKYCIESDLIIVQDWFNVNKLTLNINKSSYMIFRPNNTEMCGLNITLNGVTLPQTCSTKFLGTWLDEKLVWTEHIRNLKTKLLSRLGLLQRSRRLLSTHSTHAMKSLYYAQIHSNISYALSLWGPMTSNHIINQIQHIQNKAVSCIDIDLSMEQIYLKHGILPVPKMIHLELCKLGFKFINNMLPKPLTNALMTDHRYSSIEKVHRYETRNKCVPTCPESPKPLQEQFFI